MASKVEMCSQALVLCGSDPIVSLSDNSPGARLSNLFYDSSRKALLEQVEWNFAIKTASLAALVPAPTTGKANAFQLPVDFLHLADSYPEDNNPYRDWEIEGRKIFTNESAPLIVRYIYDVEDVNLMPFLFQKALVGDLALNLCEKLTQSNPKKLAISEYFRQAMLQARRANAFKKRPKTTPVGSWVNTRF